MLGYTDREMEMLWDEFADVPFDEDEDGRLVLSAQWQGLPAGTEREEIWGWFDKRHSRGIGWLMNEYRMEEL